MCGSSAHDTVRGPKRCPMGARDESTVIWGACVPSPAEENVEFMVEGGLTDVDRFGRMIGDVVTAMLRKD